MNDIRFLKHCVKNDLLGTSARVRYSRGNRVDGRDCVTLYAKGYLDGLYEVFGGCVENNSDIMTDYFEKDRVVIFADNPLFEAACKRCR